MQFPYLQGCQISKSFLSGGDTFFGGRTYEISCRNMQFLLFCHTTQRERMLLQIIPGFQVNGRLQTNFEFPLFEQMHCLQNFPHADYQATIETSSAGRLVHHYRLKRANISLSRWSDNIETFCLSPSRGWPVSKTGSHSVICAPRTFSRCVNVALQPLCDKAEGVFLYLDGLRTQE